MESNQFDQLYKMMSVINENQYDRRHNDYTYSRPERYGYENKMDNFQMMTKFKKMMNNMKNDDSFMNKDMMSFDWMKNKYNNKMANFFKNFRSKRAAEGDALALNDRLKEKIQHVFEEQQSKIG